jgi:hypothetical protein
VPENNTQPIDSASPTSLVRVLEFKHVRDTKRTRVYQEVDQAGNLLDVADAVCGVVYLKAAALGGARPERIRVTVEIADAS